MSATAFAFDPILDDPEVPDHRHVERPRLRIIEGEGRATDAAALAPALRSARPSVTSVEIYRRRRFFALVAVTALVLVGAWMAGISVTGFTASAPQADPAQPSVHVVMPGDSYGAIAVELGAADPVATGAALRAANGGGELVVGQRLVVDVGDLGDGAAAPVG